MTTSLLEMHVGASAPATEALEAFMSQQYSRPRLTPSCPLEKDGEPRSTPSSPTRGGCQPTLKRVRSALISPSHSGGDLEQKMERDEEPLDLSALIRAAAPVEESVAFPSIEWNADGDDDDDESDDDEHDIADLACGFFSRSLDQQLSSHGLDFDDDDDDDDCCAPPRKRRSASSLHTLAAMVPRGDKMQQGKHMRRSKCRSNSLNGLLPPSSIVEKNDANKGTGSPTLVSPFSSFGDDPSSSSGAAGPASSLLNGLLGEVDASPSATPSPSPLLAPLAPLGQWAGQELQGPASSAVAAFAVSLRPSSPSPAGAKGMRKSRSSRNFPARSSSPVGFASAASSPYLSELVGVGAAIQ